MASMVRLTIATALAVIGMAAVVGGASAGRLALGNQNFRVEWIVLRLRAAEFEFTCQLTLEGSFHSRTIAKSTAPLIGLVSRVALSRCNSDVNTGLNLPWHIKYASFRGTLPTIESVRLEIIDSSILVRAFGIGCLYQSTLASPALGEVTVASGVLTGMRMDGRAPIPLKSRLEGIVDCPASGFLEGATGTVSVLGTTTGIRISLI